jgi:lipoate-protein ligase A
MGLESKIFIYEKEPKSPIENLAVNNLFYKLVSEGRYDAFVRVYHHKPGIILANEESIEDLDYEFCKKNKLEVTTRPTAGSAVLVTPEDIICYSAIFNLPKLGMEKDSTKLYKTIVYPLTERLKNLGVPVSLEGMWYLRAKINGDRLPFAGHAVRFFGNGDIYQFDGLANLKKPPLDLIKKAIKLRKLYDYNGQRYILVRNKYYPLNMINNGFDIKNAKLIRDEENELKKMIGLKELNIDKDFFAEILFNVFDNVCKGLLKLDSLYISEADFEENKKLLLNKKFGNLKGLGHCFVDMNEEEPKLR